MRSLVGRSSGMGRWRWLAGCGVLAAWGCGDESGLAPSPVAENVERDGWVDQGPLVSGHGPTEFVSATPTAVARQQLYSSPYGHYVSFRGLYGSEGAPAVVDGQRIYGLSSYAGLVITEASTPSRLEGRFPIEGAPFSISERDGIVLALVNEYPGFVCE